MPNSKGVSCYNHEGMGKPASGAGVGRNTESDLYGDTVSFQSSLSNHQNSVNLVDVLVSELKRLLDNGAVDVASNDNCLNQVNM